MQEFGTPRGLTARVRLRIYRLLANSYIPLLVVALSVLVLRWTIPHLLSLLVIVWTADAILIVVLAIPWLLVSWAFSSGAIKCPSCGAAFATKFRLWVPRDCQNCGHDTAADHR
jgi:hypothetical protein